MKINVFKTYNSVYRKKNVDYYANAPVSIFLSEEVKIDFIP